MIALLTSVTWYLGGVDWKYLDHGSLAFSDAFPGPAEDWQNHGDETNIVIAEEGVRLSRTTDNPSYAKYPVKSLDIPNNKTGQIRVTASVKVETEDSIEEGAGAALMSWFMDSSEESVLEYRTVIPLRVAIDKSVISSQRILAIPEGSPFFYLAFINRESNGSYLLTDAALEMVSESISYLFAVGSLFLCWLLVIIVLVFTLWKKSSKLHASILLVTILIIVLGVTWPERVDGWLSLNVDRWAVTDNSWDWIYKFGHFALFFAISLHLLCYRIRLGLARWYCFCVLGLFAIATEGMQLHFIQRTTRWTDILIDVAGICAAVILVWKIENLKIRSDST